VVIVEKTRRAPDYNYPPIEAIFWTHDEDMEEIAVEVRPIKSWSDDEEGGVALNFDIPHCDDPSCWHTKKVEIVLYDSTLLDLFMSIPPVPF
jgi:hypothetical protein